MCHLPPRPAVITTRIGLCGHGAGSVPGILKCVFVLLPLQIHLTCISATQPTSRNAACCPLPPPPPLPLPLPLPPPLPLRREQIRPSA